MPGGDARGQDASRTDTVITLGAAPTTSDAPDATTSLTSSAVTSANAQVAANVTTTQGSSEPGATSTSSSSTTMAEPRPSDDVDNDPLSDNASFLSFEEWKAQMLKKAGQSPDHVSGSGSEKARDNGARRPPGINNALESYGEEGEIEIEFGGFVTPDAAPSARPAQTEEATEKQYEGSGKEEKARKYNKDAGTTSKERTNFASFDCAATVLKTNQGCKGPTSILLENKDSYMLNTCATDNKFLIVELCNDILIDTIVLGNFEFFSSTFRQFRVSVSDRYPVKIDKWKEIGTFEARNSRGVQAFLVENGLIWTRYLSIEFLSHYGKEYYCPVSLLRVHGKTMMDDYRAGMKAARGEDNDDDELEEEPAEKVVAEPLKESSSSSEAASTTLSSTEKNQTADGTAPNWQDAPLIDKCPRKSLSSPVIQQAELFGSACKRTARFCNMATVQVIKNHPVADARRTRTIAVTTPSSPMSQIDQTKTKANSAAKTSPSNSAAEPTGDSSSTRPQLKSTPASSKSKEGPTAQPTESREKASQSSSKRSEGAGSSKAQAEQATATVTKIPSTPVPATQESFFRSVHKRLLQLEANSTLSLQYIEEQSRILRDAFTKVEKRQLSKTSQFLETLNTTVLSELREFRLQYDQIWQSTVLELSSQREQSQKEVTALSQRLTFLADEILWQKRIAYLQFVFILLCLGLILFPRTQVPSASTFDLQSMVAKPSSSFARYLNLDISPPTTPSRPGSRYGLFNRGTRFTTHFRGTSQDTLSDDEGVKAPEINHQLPTPTQSHSNSDEESVTAEDVLLSSPEADPLIRRAQSTPNLAKESDDLLASPDEEMEEPVPQNEESIESPS